jgi:hypothetical protein
MKSAWIVVACAVMLVGCVEREWTISSEPAGAIVEVSGVEKGRTPLTMSFTYYGDYEVIFRKAGYETLKTSVDLKPPVYQWVGIDFFAEIFPHKYEDRRETMHVLKKAIPVSDADLMKRAAQMRKKTLADETLSTTELPADEIPNEPAPPVEPNPVPDIDK